MDIGIFKPKLNKLISDNKVGNNNPNLTFDGEKANNKEVEQNDGSCNYRSNKQALLFISLAFGGTVIFIVIAYFLYKKLNKK